MTDEVKSREAAVESAKEYAENECIGTFGDVVEVREGEAAWTVVFRTHTYADEHRHRVQVNRVGNVVSHERGD